MDTLASLIYEYTEDNEDESIIKAILKLETDQQMVEFMKKLKERLIKAQENK